MGGVLETAATNTNVYTILFFLFSITLIIVWLPKVNCGFLNSNTNLKLDIIKKIQSHNIGLKKSVLQIAMKAKMCAMKKGLNPKNDIITVIDYSLPSTAKRLFVINLNKAEIMYSLHTAHGQGSGDNYAHKFSDQPQSHQSSLGVFLTGDIYEGHHGPSLSLIGMEKDFNSNAYKRHVVIHAANYVSDDFARKHGRLGRSHGCPALEPKYTKEVIETIKNGTLLVNYYPDPKWIKQSEYLNC
jgi:hypothetical protein